MPDQWYLLATDQRVPCWCIQYATKNKVVAFNKNLMPDQWEFTRNRSAYDLLLLLNIDINGDVEGALERIWL